MRSLKNWPVVVLLLAWALVAVRAATVTSPVTEIVFMKSAADMPTQTQAGPPNATVIVWYGHIQWGSYAYLEYCTDANGAVVATTHPGIKGLRSGLVCQAVLVDVGHSVTPGTFAYTSGILMTWAKGYWSKR